MTDPMCSLDADQWAELALGILTGRERERALAHVAECPRCRGRLRDLAETADHMVDLIPEAAPPPGFTGRVLGALEEQRRAAQPPPDRPRRHTVIRVAAAGTAVTLLLVSGFLRGDSAPGEAESPEVRTVLYAPVLVDQRQIGTAYLYPGPPGWIHLSLVPSGIRPESPLLCTLVGADGSRQTVGTFVPGAVHDEWSAPVPPAASPVDDATLTGTSGGRVGVAHFGRKHQTALVGRPRQASIPAIPPSPARPDDQSESRGGDNDKHQGKNDHNKKDQNKKKHDKKKHSSKKHSSKKKHSGEKHSEKDGHDKERHGGKHSD